MTSEADRPSAAKRSSGWIFSPTVDLATFGGSAVASLLLLAIGWRCGWLDHAAPEWTWIVCVLAVDVAHVWSTAFRAYVEPREWRRRPGLLIGVPLGSIAVAWLLHSEDPLLFWRAAAYLAVWHFVRQQYGWVAWYRRAAGETGTIGRAIDLTAIHAATVVPLIHWHAALPRQFEWFTAGDFVAFPEGLATRTLLIVAWAFWWLALGAYAIKGIVAALRHQARPGKDLVVASTALLWYLGIVRFDSDYAFTVTNVLIHGVPYLVLIVAYRAGALSTGDRGNEEGGSTAGHDRASRVVRIGLVVLATAWGAAYLEELLWDRMVWHERPWLFGSGDDQGSATSLWVALLAAPQLSHYVLDGFLWRRRDR